MKQKKCISRGLFVLILFFMIITVSETAYAAETYSGIEISSGFGYPMGIVSGSDGTLYVSEYGSGKIVKMDRDGQNKTTFATGMDGPVGITFDDSGNLYVAEHNGGAVKKVDLAGDTTIVKSFSTELTGIVIDSNGKIFVIDYTNGTLYKMDLDGTNSSVFASLTASANIGMTIDASDNIYVSDERGKVTKVTPEGDVSDFITGVQYPTGVTLGEDGFFYVSAGNQTIIKANSKGEIVGTFSTDALSVWDSFVDEVGYIYFTDDARGSVQKLVGSASAIDTTHISLLMNTSISNEQVDKEAFTMSGIASAPSVTAAEVSGQTIYLTLSAAITYSDTDIKLAYTQTGSNDLLSLEGSVKLDDFSGLRVNLLQNQAAPTGLAGVAPTSALNDGKITGTTIDMEYKLASADDSTYAACSADATTVATAGDYVVRLSARAGYNAGKAAAVTVPAEYTVTFNTNGGSSISQITTTAGNTITAPTAPMKSEYTFDGWYKDSGLSIKFDFANDTISANTTLYAKWKFNAALKEISGKINSITEVPNSNFGYALSAAGDLLAVGANYELLSNDEEDGAVYIYDLTKSEGETGYERKIVMTNNQNNENDDDFGRDIDLISNENSTFLLVGAQNFKNENGLNTGASFLYDLNKSEDDVRFETKLVPSDGANWIDYGKYVALNDKYAIVGAYSGGSKSEGAVYVYDRTASNLQASEIKIIPTDGQPDDNFGRVLELEDDTLVVSSYKASDYTGAVYIYDLTKSPGDTGFEVKVVPDDLEINSAFGKSLAIDNGTLIVGAYYDNNKQGSVYVFDISDLSNITQILKLKSRDIADDDRYGRSVSLSGNNLVVGAYRADIDGKSDAGAAYLYDLSATNVQESEVKFVTDDLQSDDELGRAILIHDEYVFIGAADGDGDSGAEDPGAVYISYLSIIRDEEVTVTFNTNGGSAIPPITITAGNTITAPTAPTKSGYTFDGWYKDSGLADKYDFTNDTISANTTLYAKWNRNRSSNTSNNTQKIVVADVKKDGDDKAYSVTGIMKTLPKKVEVVVDEKSIKDSIKTAKNHAVVKVLVPKDKDEISAIFSVKDVEEMAEKELAISVQTEKAIYELPTNDVKLDVVHQAFGEDVDTSKIEFEVIQKVTSSSMEKIIVETAEKEDVQILMPSIDFEIKANYRGKSVKIEKFKKYVTRKISLPDNVDASKVTTATITKPDGTICHVPTYVELIDGKYYAIVNSLTNSTYTLIYNEKTFDDIDMWAKDSIENMASRLVVEGDTDLLFDPNKEMTRANFTKFVVKSLGLAPLDYIEYTDVNMDQDYAGYIQIASEYGIINGIGGGLFEPNANITREEAMTILYRIKDILDYEGNELNLDMTKFTDYVNVSTYAKDAVIWNVNSSVIKGKSAEILDPKANITKAEVATVLERILQRAELIQE